MSLVMSVVAAFLARILHLHLHRYVEPSQFDYYTTVLTSNGDTIR